MKKSAFSDSSIANKQALSSNIVRRREQTLVADNTSRQEGVALLQAIQSEMKHLVHEVLKEIAKIENATALARPQHTADAIFRLTIAQGQGPNGQHAGHSLEMRSLAASSDPSKSGDSVRRHGHSLTRREREILSLLAKGLNTKALARIVNISYATARNHIQHIYSKLGVHNRAEAVSYSFCNNIFCCEGAEQARTTKLAPVSNELPITPPPACETARDSATSMRIARVAPE